MVSSCEAKSVTLDGEAVDFCACDGKTRFAISKDDHRARKLTYKVEM